MIVIGTDLVEGYLADHAGHKGITAQSQYKAWLDIVELCQLAQSEGCQGVISEHQHSQGRSDRFQY
jgi:hypothetical protein